MNIIYDSLFHKDENGNVRVWWMEQDGNKYRTFSGVDNGNLVLSEWKEVEGKNEGKKNATTGIQQATAEIEALYRKKLKGKYHKNREDVDKGSNIIQPMLAEKYLGWNDKNVRGQVLFSQPKLDGMRCLATKDGLFSREGSSIVSSPHISEELKDFFNTFPDVVLDGELYNHELKNDFNKLLSLARKTKPTIEDHIASKEKIQYHVYDVIMPGSFRNRQTFLKDYFHTGLISNYCIKLVETVEISGIDELDGLYAIYLSKGYEGQMVRTNGPYEQKRSKFLMKRKEFLDGEFPVDEIVEGEGNWAGYSKSVRSHTKDGVVFNAGIKGNQEFAKELLTRNPVPKTVTIRYQNVTPDGSLRFPIAVAFYENEKDV